MKIVTVLMFAGVLGCILMLKLNISNVERTLERYDPNDLIYKYIPEAPEDWTEKFGTSERTRLMHSISELRVVVAAQGKRILALEDPNKAE